MKILFLSACKRARRVRYSKLRPPLSEKANGLFRQPLRWLALSLSLSLLFCSAALAVSPEEEAAGEPVPISELGETAPITDEGFAVPISDEGQAVPISDEDGTTPISDETETTPISDDPDQPVEQVTPGGPLTSSQKITVTYQDGDTVLYQVTIPAGTAPEVYPILDASDRPVVAWVLNGKRVADPTAVVLTANTTFAVWTAPALNTTEHIAYISGKSSTTFDPNGSLTRAEAASLLAALLTDDALGDLDHTFSDVSSASWYGQPVTLLSSLGLLSGYADGTFRPDALITRAEFVTMLTALSSLETTSQAAFSDVPASHWAQKNIQSAAAKGWVAGYPDGTFRPDQAVTRAEAVVILNAVLGRSAEEQSSAATVQSSSSSPFLDVRQGQWFYADVMEAAVSH